jgi:hypothetical protein
MKYMMFVVADPDAAAEAEPSADDLTIEQWLADVDGRGKRVTGLGHHRRPPRRPARRPTVAGGRPESGHRGRLPRRLRGRLGGT